MSRKFPVNDFKQITETVFIKSCIGDSDEGYFLEVDVQYSESLHNLYNDLPVLPERM